MLSSSWPVEASRKASGLENSTQENVRKARELIMPSVASLIYGSRYHSLCGKTKLHTMKQDIWLPLLTILSINLLLSLMIDIVSLRDEEMGVIYRL